MLRSSTKEQDGVNYRNNVRLTPEDTSPISYMKKIHVRRWFARVSCKRYLCCSYLMRGFLVQEICFVSGLTCGFGHRYITEEYGVPGTIYQWRQMQRTCMVRSFSHRRGMRSAMFDALRQKKRLLVVIPKHSFCSCLLTRSAEGASLPASKHVEITASWATPFTQDSYWPLVDDVRARPTHSDRRDITFNKKKILRGTRILVYVFLLIRLGFSFRRSCLLVLIYLSFAMQRLKWGVLELPLPGILGALSGLR